ncbi:MAG: hypothetical protein LBJ36_08700 [Synergistaceae bacterium]|jgi:hypothetical protein|nr:hypothetical protein [Synergistaceae bacterium]
MRINTAVGGVDSVFGFLSYVYFHVKLLLWLINVRCGCGVEHDQNINQDINRDSNAAVNILVNILRVGAFTLKRELKEKT